MTTKIWTKEPSFALAYRGFARETEVLVHLERITPEICRIDCIECEGFGSHLSMHVEGNVERCVECKGTGKVLVTA